MRLPFFIFAFLCFSTGYSQLSLKWDKNFKGIDGSNEIPLLIEKDSSDNFYSIVNTSGKIAVNKYNSSGSLQFSTIIAASVIYDIIIDNIGTVVLVGANGYNLYLAKIDTNGNLIWSAGSASIKKGNSITIDNLGNIYVTGQYKTNDIVTCKYSSTGSLIWSTLFPNPSFKDSNTGEKILYYQNSIYVGGIGADSLNIHDQFFFIKYDLNGNLLWNIEEGGELNRDAILRDMTIDSYGNLIFTGTELYITGFTTRKKIVHYKIDNQGNLLEEIDHDHSYVGEMEGYYNHLDINDNLYIVGWRNTNGIKNLELVKYDSLGNYQWSRTYNVGYDVTPSAISENIDGNIIISFNANNTINPSIESYIISYSPVGDMNWIVNSENSNAGFIINNNNGQIHLSESIFRSGTNMDNILTKFSKDGVKINDINYSGANRSNNKCLTSTCNNELLFSIFEITPQNSTKFYSLICHDTLGNINWIDTIYVSGLGPYFFNLLATDSFIYLASITKRDSFKTYKINVFDGVILWGASDKIDGDIKVAGIALDDSNNVYISCRGNLYTQSSTNQFLTFKYDPKGNKQWVKEWNRSVSGFNEHPYGIKYHDGFIYVYGSSRNGNPSPVSRVLKYDLNGNLIWNSLVNIGDKSPVLKDLIFDNLGNIYVCGIQQSIPLFERFYKAFVYKVNDLTGGITWVDDIGTPITVNNEDYLAGFNSYYYASITEKNNGNIQFVSSCYRRLSNIPDVYNPPPLDTSIVIIEYDVNGNRVKAKMDTLSSVTIVNAALYNNDEFYLSGSKKTASNSFDYFIVKYNSSLQIINTISYDISSHDYITKVCDNKDYIFISGKFLDNTYDDEIKTLAYSKKNTLTRLIENKTTSFQIKSYPNPTANSVIVMLDKVYKKISTQIINTNGQILFSKEFDNTDILNYSLNEFSNGLYFLRVKFDNNNTVLKLVKRD